jgi:hypothetical protein
MLNLLRFTGIGQATAMGFIRRIPVLQNAAEPTAANSLPFKLSRHIHDDRNDTSVWSFLWRPRNEWNSTSCPQGPYTSRPYERI